MPGSLFSLLGVPLDINSSYLRGAAEAPALIRKALFCDSANLWTEDGLDLGAPGAFVDAGDLDLPDDAEAAVLAIEAGVRAALAPGHPLICLGGDHSVTYPILRGYDRRSLTILQFDAHPDLHDRFEGSRLSHACQFARIMEDGLAKRLVQVGIRTMNGHQREQAARFGVEVIPMQELEKFAALDLTGPLYISFDLDVFDPAFVPGVSHYEPGGMSVREALAFLQALRTPIAGADIVEYNPTRDRDFQTGMVAAKILKEIGAAMVRSNGVKIGDPT